MSEVASTKSVFSSVEEEPLLSKPISKMALASFALGVIGLLAPLTGALIPVPVLAALTGVIGSLLLGRAASSHSGARLANVGLFLGVMSIVWALLSVKAERDSLTKSGGEFASHYLTNLADGNVYVAAELQQAFPARQLPGLDLKTYYDSYKAKAPDSSTMKEEDAPDPRMLAKMRVDKIRDHEVSKYVQRFPNATWSLSNLQELNYRDASHLVVVNMRNSEDPTRSVSVALTRQLQMDKGKTVADWFVQDMKLY